MGRSRSRSPRRCSISPSRTKAEVEIFLRQEPEIEERAARLLQSKPIEVQRAVLARGGLSGTRNPTAVLVSRIRNAEEGLRPVAEHEKAGEEIERFLVIERVEAHAAARLRRAPKAVQLAVVTRGTLSGTRDPTAVLMTRIRDAEKELIEAGKLDPSRGRAFKDAGDAALNPYAADPQAYAMAYYAQYQQAYPQAVQSAYSQAVLQLAAAYANLPGYTAVLAYPQQFGPEGSQGDVTYPVSYYANDSSASYSQLALPALPPLTDATSPQTVPVTTCTVPPW